MKLSTILDQIDIGSIALPEFQRGYVWNRDQVRKLMNSLYKKHPVGSLLVWITNIDDKNVRGIDELPPGSIKLLLDGQQRITSLYGIARGKSPKFFQGNENAFTGLYFNIEEEVFEFFAPLKMKDNPLWINVTELMQKGLGDYLPKLTVLEKVQDDINTYVNRLNAVSSILDHQFHIEEVTGPDKTIETVVDIFNQVNSGGTKLSKGDLALAKICAGWPEARGEMNKKLEKWKESGYPFFKLDWLLRCVNTIVTGEALFVALKNISSDSIKEGLKNAERYINTSLNMISSRLGLDNGWVLGSPYSIPLIVRYLHDRGGQLVNQTERDKLLFWYIHTFLWGRYAGSTESVLNQDLDAIEDKTEGLNNLIKLLRRDRGDLNVHPNDFMGWSKGARFYPLLYMLTRVFHAKDWGTGVELASHTLGRQTDLQIHHIFPKALLYKHGYDKSQVNALANFTFLTQETNLSVSDREPEKYFDEFEKKNPGLIKTHWIPMDKELWKIENYLDFLEARRTLLSDAANEFLNSLYSGAIEDVEIEDILIPRDIKSIQGGIEDEEEERKILETNIWVIDNGLPEGELLYDLTDINTGESLAILDLAWPDGLQEGFSLPVALLINEEQETLDRAQACGFRYFTDVDSFKEYISKEILT